eukprot:gnl/MRDRNA2_/MRDRNA2_81033_c0_seq3.p1 gnl/MRDRNA2_/MRDRNA2_81033_c0~~gnl/MRDRNA2_/MRDRNA2_81033_c0_seq3.p1  ORF type:complete len:388 (-),score=66.65 gnl/MRDRNA2_/MRDRNA2_81033_c0_seq3:51-1214(-)
MVKVTWGHVTSITWQEDEDQSHGNGDSGHVEGESEVTSTDMKWHGLNVVSSMNYAEFVEWVESPIRAHKGLVLPEVDKNKESGESTVPIRSELALSEADQHKEWVDSPIRSHDNKLGLVQVEQNRHHDRSASVGCFRETQGFGTLTQEPPLQHSGCVPDSSQQAFMTFEAKETSVSPCAVPVPLLPPGCMQHGSGTVDYSEQQNLSWFIVSFVGSLDVFFLRHGPDINARCTGFTLLKDEIFSVNQEIASPDGRIYLCLADGRGWAFDDAALTLEDPSATSVIRMDFKPGSNAFISSYNASTLQHGEQPQFGPITTESLNPHNLEPMNSSCVSCTSSIDANAKFCIICGEKQPSPLGIANPGGEVRFPHYQYEVQHTPWLEPYTHYC